LNQNVIKVVENITNIPDNHSEYWQFLQYEETQFYAVSSMMIVESSFLPSHFSNFAMMIMLSLYIGTS
jgi:hypothetical protein